MNEIKRITFTGKISYTGTGTKEDPIELVGGQDRNLYPLILRHLGMKDGYVNIWGQIDHVWYNSISSVWASDSSSTEILFNKGYYGLPARTKDDLT